MERKLKIGVFFNTNVSSNESSHFILLDKVSEYLSELQLVPNVGDGLTIFHEDASKIGVEDKTSLEHIQTVYRRWLNYSTCDIAIFVSYKPW